MAPIIDYRTTHWSFISNPGVYKSTTTAFINLHKDATLKKLKLFPNDLVIAWFTDREEKEILRRFHPAKLALYKYIWDNIGKADRKLLHKHIKRSVDIREQFKKGLCSEEVRIWYMALVLGAEDDV